jgi:hypothetical protein
MLACGYSCYFARHLRGTLKSKDYRLIRRLSREAEGKTLMSPIKLCKSNALFFSDNKYLARVGTVKNSKLGYSYESLFIEKYIHGKKSRFEIDAHSIAPLRDAMTTILKWSGIEPESI